MQFNFASRRMLVNYSTHTSIEKQYSVSYFSNYLTKYKFTVSQVDKQDKRNLKYA